MEKKTTTVDLGKLALSAGRILAGDVYTAATQVWKFRRVIAGILIAVFLFMVVISALIISLPILIIKAIVPEPLQDLAWMAVKALGKVVSFVVDVIKAIIDAIGSVIEFFFGETISSTYPYISYELSDPEGVFVGINDHNGSSVMLNIFDTSKYYNANMVLLGTSGVGKTTTIQILARRMRLQNIPIMMICPFKGFEYRRMCESLGGNFIRIAPGSKQTINILDIRPSSGEGNAEESLLAARLQKLQIFFSLMFPGISQLEQHRLDKRLLEVYARKGITNDNSSIYLHNRVEDKISFKPELKEMPTLRDLYEIIKNDEDLQEISEKLESYVSGSLSFFNGQTNVNLDNDYIVADISDMQENVIPLAMFTVLDIFWDKIKSDITQKKCLILDEAWKLMGAGGNAQTAKFVLELFKTFEVLAAAPLQLPRTSLIL